MRRSPLILLVALLATAATASGQDKDSTFLPVQVDSMLADSLSRMPDSASTQDSLSAMDVGKLMIERMEKHKETIKREPSLSYIDSAVTYFAPARMNYADDIERSYYRDAGDFFHCDPSFVIVDYQGTPTRKTVQPFGLRSNRLNFVINGVPLVRFEHVIEPDGLVDLNDLPTTASRDIYVVPGPAGQLFKGQQAVATLVTVAARPVSHTPQSAFLVDQGSFDFNHVRGRFAKTSSTGREADLSVAYRNADGADGFPDDAYHYTGKVFWPIGADWGVTLSGQLYDRYGWLKARPDRGDVIKRDRIDRSAEIAVERLNSRHTERSEAGYRYLKQGSHLDNGYNGRFDISGDGIFGAREWLVGSSILRTEVRGDRETYTDGYNDWDRHSAGVNLRAVSMGSGWRYGLSAGASYVSTQKVLPSLSFNLLRETKRMLILLSAGYTERAPSLYELNLRFQQARVYSSDRYDYADQGNPDLSAEKQVVGNATVALGEPAGSLQLSLTGGTITDGIEWRHQDVFDDAGGSYLLFSPINTDIKFLNATLQKRITITDLLALSAGGSYHWIEYDAFANRPYSPDYQFFASGELHVYWPQKIMHLFAYGELVYVSEYEGYNLSGLGKSLVANVKLSFRIKDFRFHFVVQNALSESYQSHEYWWQPRHSYFGLIWNFLD